MNTPESAALVEKTGADISTQIEAQEAPQLELGKRPDGVVEIKASGDLEQLRAAAGSSTVLSGLESQIAALGARHGRTDADVSNFVLGFVYGMGPRDPAETLLFTQMATVHQAMMSMSRRLNNARTPTQQEAAERALNKLARTFTTQMETLKKYRSNGQQVVRVERVTVESGGQAIVGNVEPGGGHEKR